MKKRRKAEEQLYKRERTLLVKSVMLFQSFRYVSRSEKLCCSFKASSTIPLHKRIKRKSRRHSRRRGGSLKSNHMRRTERKKPEVKSLVPRSEICCLLCQRLHHVTLHSEQGGSRHITHEEEKCRRTTIEEVRNETSMDSLLERACVRLPTYMN